MLCTPSCCTPCPYVTLHGPQWYCVTHNIDDASTSHGPQVDRQNAAAIYRTAESFGVQEVWEVVSPVTKRGGDSDSMSQNERNKKKKKKKKTEMEMESNPDADAASMTDGGNGNAAKGAGPAAKAVKGRAQSSKGAEKWLTLRHFASTADCIKALREEQQCEVWATDLGPGAHCIHPLAGLADGGGSATTLGADGDGSDTPYEPLALPAGKRRLAIVMGTLYWMQHAVMSHSDAS